MHHFTLSTCSNFTKFFRSFQFPQSQKIRRHRKLDRDHVRHADRRRTRRNHRDTGPPDRREITRRTTKWRPQCAADDTLGSVESTPSTAGGLPSGETRIPREVRRRPHASASRAQRQPPSPLRATHRAPRRQPTIFTVVERRRRRRPTRKNGGGSRKSRYTVDGRGKGGRKKNARGGVGKRT